MSLVQNSFLKKVGMMKEYVEADFFSCLLALSVLADLFAVHHEKLPFVFTERIEQVAVESQ